MNSNVFSQLPSIFALAHDRTESGRVLLADKLAEVFFSDSVTLNSREERLVDELIAELLKNDNEEIRDKLIMRFAEAINAPRPTALRIAHSPIELARPILIGNANLEDDDLISIVETSSLSHASAIAHRQEISEAVADALVTTGDLEIMQIVAENMGAKLSVRALNLMIDAARLTAMLQKPIMQRPELTPETAIRLYWWTAQDLRRATLERFGFGPGKLDDALKQAIEEKLHASLLQKDDTNQMEGIANWLEDRHALKKELLPRLLRAGHYRLFNVLLSRLSNVDLDLIDMITNAEGGKYFAALCRAINVDKGNFVSIFLMARGGRPGENIVHPKELRTVLATFDKLDETTASAMLKTWKENPQDLIDRIESDAEIMEA